MAVTETNTLQATITSTDANGNTSITRDLGSPALPGVYGQMMINQVISAGTQALNMPSVPVYNFYIKNGAAPGSGITFHLLITPHGQAQVLATPEIQPGGVTIPVWNIINTVVAGGIDAISIVVTGGSCPVEYFFGA